jgi:hypothetical protein
MVEEVEHWFNALSPADRALASAAIDLLRDRGPLLGRPLVDRITGSKLHNLKELRPGSTGTTEARVLFIFDPKRRAVLLVGGDKSGHWQDWYKTNIPLAEQRYERWLNNNNSP